MENIIFLDIDGVLNDKSTFVNNTGIKNAYNKLLNSFDNTCSINYAELLAEKQLLYLDYDKIQLLKYICDTRNAKIVITSSWKNLTYYNFIEEKLILYGLPIIDITKTLLSRGEEIKKYIQDNNIENYIIIDDSVFEDYDEELKYNLIYTDFYSNGLDYEKSMEAIYKLIKK